MPRILLDQCCQHILLTAADTYVEFARLGSYDPPRPTHSHSCACSCAA